MRRTIRPNICAAYSLHDMTVVFQHTENGLVLRTMSGMTRTGDPVCRVDGFVEFEDVQWDFSFVYMMDHVGNTGAFSGEKMGLVDFIEKYPGIEFTVMDETYGFNMTKYSGSLLSGGELYECLVEICHEGDMIFVEDTRYEGMGDVILSHDGEALLCRVPAEVADHLQRYCLDFAANWVWHGPENGRFLRRMDEDMVVAIFGTAEFIEYLNRWAFPDQGAQIVRGLGCTYDEIPEEYANLPAFNF